MAVAQEQHGVSATVATTIGRQPDSLLASRTFRNHFEHFDERLDDWAANVQSEMFFDSNIGAGEDFDAIEKSQEQVLGEKVSLRGFDRDGFIVRFRDDRYDLRAIAQEIETLHDDSLLLYA